jgi:hypothetical protein
MSWLAWWSWFRFRTRTRRYVPVVPQGQRAGTQPRPAHLPLAAASGGGRAVDILCGVSDGFIDLFWMSTKRIFGTCIPSENMLS